MKSAGMVFQIYEEPRKKPDYCLGAAKHEKKSRGLRLEKVDQTPRFSRLEFVIKMMSYSDGEHIKSCVCSPCYRTPRREAIWIIGFDV